MAQILSIDIIRWIMAGVVLTCTFLIAHIASRFLKRVFKRGSLPVETGKAATRLIQYLIYAIGAIVILAVLQFDLTEAIIGLGAFGIAISIALGNLIDRSDRSRNERKSGIRPLLRASFRVPQRRFFLMVLA